MTVPRILVVGAGAVGQVFALHLQRGGSHVSFFVKPTHPLPRVLTLFSKARDKTALTDFERLDSLEQMARERWDQVWLAVPSDALPGTWLPALVEATQGATIVGLGPESSAQVPADRLVVGAIPFLAWQQPLPEEAGEPGIAFWFPPLARVPVSGPDDRVKAVIQGLRAGGIRASRVRDSAASAAPVTAILIATVAALEGAGWSFRAYRGKWSRLGACAAKEALRLCGAPLLFRPLANAWLVRTVLWIGARIAPFHLERYIRFHFTKVGPQTRMLLEHWMDRGKDAGIATPCLQELLAVLSRHP